MNLDQESVSLKILRMLYSFHKQNQTSGLDEETISNRFDSYDLEKLKSIVQEALTTLIKASLIKEIKDNKKLLYSITEKGIEYYKSFKMLSNDSKTTPKNTNYNISISGNWHGDNQHQQHDHHHHDNENLLNHAENVNFSTESEEFIAHYSELMKLIEECEKDAMDGLTNKQGGRVLEHLAEMKIIINQDSTIMGGRLRIMEKMIGQLKIMAEHSRVNMTKESMGEYD